MAEKNATHDLAGHRLKDRDAFQKLVERFRPRLERQVRARLGREARTCMEVDDVLQETFAKAFQMIEKLRWQGEESFYRWLASIAEHLIWNASQKSARRPLELKEEPLAGSSASPSKALRRKERLERLEEALRALSPDHRTVIVLARIERLKIEKIAERMDRSPNAVKKLLARALIELKRRFGDTESLHLPDKAIQAEGVGNGA
jgi:RNA polymerase sigma-70 factor (ECF subfamily)